MTTPRNPFENPMVASLYDLVDSPRREDLDPYVAMVDEFSARSILDIGCGTGVLACRLAARGKEVVGLEPAAPMLDIARKRPWADRVTWIQGFATDLPAMQVDLVTMTANIAQVFLGDEEWLAVLRACHRVLRRGGRLVFETRDPAREAWKSWTRERSYTVMEAAGWGTIESWHELTGVQLPCVSFRSTVLVRRDGTTIAEESTLRFRTLPELTDSLGAANLSVDDVRDAPDRPGAEFVVVAHRA